MNNAGTITLSAEFRRICIAFEHCELGRDDFLQACSRLVARHMGCSRAGIWMFEGRGEGRQLSCLAMFDGIRGCATRVPPEIGAQVGTYFAALEGSGYVLADDAREHAATAGFFNAHLDSNGVKSLLAVAFSVNGRLYGAFTCTQVGTKMNWTARNLALLRSIAARASLAIANAERVESETRPGLLSER